MTLHPFRKKVRTFRSSRQPVAHNKRIAPHRFCVNLAQLPKCGARICAILISDFSGGCPLAQSVAGSQGADQVFLRTVELPSGRRARLLTRDCLSALRRLFAADYGNLRTLFCGYLIRMIVRKVRFGQSFAGGAMLAPPAQSAGMFGRHCPAPSDGPMSRRKSQGLPRDSRSLR